MGEEDGDPLPLAMDRADDASQDLESFVEDLRILCCLWGIMVWPKSNTVSRFAQAEDTRCQNASTSVPFFLLWILFDSYSKANLRR